MAWMKAAENQTMGAAAKEWLRRKKERSLDRLRELNQ
jgi:hypothetical protein